MCLMYRINRKMYETYLSYSYADFFFGSYVFSLCVYRNA